MKSLPRWLIVLFAGLALSAAALFAIEVVTLAKSNAPIARAFNNWLIVLRNTQAIVYVILGAVMTLVANRLIK